MRRDILDMYQFSDEEVLKVIDRSLTTSSIDDEQDRS